MNRYTAVRALIMRAFLLGLTIFLTASTPPPPDSSFLTVNLAAHRPIQALYQIDVLVAQRGWTAELAQSAGDIWEALDDLPRAVSYWQIADKLQPKNPQRIQRLAQSYLELERYAQAVIPLSQCVELNVAVEWAHFQLGILQSVLDTSSAASHLELAARDPQYQALTAQILPLLADTSDVARAMNIGIVLATAKRWAEASYAFQYASSLSPNLPEALAYSGFSRDQQGKNGSPQIEQAIAIAPENAQVRYLQGLHLHLNGDENGSLMALRQAVSLDPLNPAYAAELGTTYDRAGDAVQAEYWYKAAVSLSGNDPRFQSLLNAFYTQPSLSIITATP